jgi:PGF-CTERM protein
MSRPATRPLAAAAVATLVVASVVVVGAVSARTATAASAPILGTGPAAQENATVSLRYEGDGPTFRPTAGQTVAGETTLSPGTELTVRLRSSGEGTPFLRSKSTTVAENGSFAVSFDMRDLQDADAGEVIVAVRADGQQQALVEGQLETDPTATPTDTQSSDSTVPGFGVLVALLGLVGAAALAARQ